MPDQMQKPRRSVLYVPASNAKAMAKIATLDCDAIIIDLEDAVAPEAKDEARAGLKRLLDSRDRPHAETLVRINALTTEWGNDDLHLVRSLDPDGIVLPKVDTARDLLELVDLLDDEDASGDLKLWAMIETPRGLLNVGAIAELGRDPASRVAGFIVGTNDLAAETGTALVPDRRYLTPWLMQVVLAARAGGLVALDGVMNQFADLDAFVKECAEGAAMGFDGKTLIHPSQIAPANSAYSPSPEALAWAQGVIAAFAASGSEGKGAIAMEGRMVERMHLRQAQRLVLRARK